MNQEQVPGVLWFRSLSKSSSALAGESHLYKPTLSKDDELKILWEVEAMKFPALALSEDAIYELDWSREHTTFWVISTLYFQWIFAQGKNASPNWLVDLAVLFRKSTHRPMVALNRKGFFIWNAQFCWMSIYNLAKVMSVTFITSGGFLAHSSCKGMRDDPLIESSDLNVSRNTVE